MIRAVMTRGKVGHIDVQLAVLDGFFASGLSVTADALATSNVIGAALAPGRHPLFRWSIRTVDGGPVRSSSGVEIRADAALDPAAGEIVIAFGPGMADADRVLADVVRPDARALTSVLRGAHQRGAQVAASCSSTFLLAEAGLLDGGEATTSWWLAPLFRSRYPAIRLRADEIVCASGTVLTAAAAMAQLDLSLVVQVGAVARSQDRGGDARDGAVVVDEHHAVGHRVAQRDPMGVDGDPEGAAGVDGVDGDDGVADLVVGEEGPAAPLERHLTPSSERRGPVGAVRVDPVEAAREGREVRVQLRACVRGV